MAFDLNAFFAVTGNDPVEITAADVFDSWPISGDRTVVRLADRESGLSARTIARRLAAALHTHPGPGNAAGGLRRCEVPGLRF